MKTSSVVLTLGLVTSVFSSSMPIQERDISATTLSNLQFFAQYAGAAYCPDNGNSTGDALECSDDVCNAVEADKAKTTLEFNDDIDNNELPDEVGFVAVDDVRKLVVLSYRGSSTIRNFVDDILFSKTDCDFGSGCEAHVGFMTAYIATEDVVLQAVEAAVAANPSYTLVVTGHSLGGAVATIAAASLRDAGYPCDLYTYGSPRVFNSVGANYVTNQTGGNYRVTHYDDPVPKLPPILLSYHHISPEYWLGTGNSSTVDYPTANVTICPGITNVTCNAGTGGFDVTAHSYYFEDIDACAPSFAFKRDLSSRDGMSDEDLANLIDIDAKYAAALNSASS